MLLQKRPHVAHRCYQNATGLLGRMSHSPSLPLSSSKETWKKKEREVWCSRTRQARANRQRRKATAGHVITTHPRKAVSGGGVCRDSSQTIRVPWFSFAFLC